MKLRTLTTESAVSELSAAQDNYELAQEAADAMRTSRDESILEAVKAGLSYSQIAAALGMSQC